MSIFAPIRPGSYEDFSRLFSSRLQMVALGMVALGLLALPSAAGSYVLGYATLILIFAIGAVGFNILVGWTGLVSLGFSGFFAIGAYVNGYLLAKQGWSLIATLPAAALVSALASLLVGIPSLRLRGLYLAITTLAFSVIVNHLIVVAKPITGGSAGLRVPRPRVFDVSLASDSAIYVLCLAVFGLVLLFAVNIRRSFIGRALFAIRDYEVAARVLGVHVVGYKLLAFALSSAVIGLAGALFGLHMRYLNVESFDLIVSIEAVSIVIVGGLGTLSGAVLGTVVMVLLPEFARLMFTFAGGVLLERLSSNAQEIKGLIYGGVILFFLRVAPEGLVGMIRKQYDRLRRWPLGP